jgi:hypothetical protein
MAVRWDITTLSLYTHELPYTLGRWGKDIFYHLFASFLETDSVRFYPFYGCNISSGESERFHIRSLLLSRNISTMRKTPCCGQTISNSYHEARLTYDFRVSVDSDSNKHHCLSSPNLITENFAFNKLEAPTHLSQPA